MWTALAVIGAIIVWCALVYLIIEVIARFGAFADDGDDGI